MNELLMAHTFCTAFTTGQLGHFMLVNYVVPVLIGKVAKGSWRL